jgi:enamine deaminase RidA (YjgF/YER057c/UK114 family)
VAESTQHPRHVAVQWRAAIKESLGGFKSLHQLAKVFGMVDAVPDFANTEMINGTSALFIQVLGIDKGSHARSASGVGSLPKGYCVEIEAIV